MKMGSGSVTKRGDVVGIAVAVNGWSGYYPIAHEGGGNMDRKKVLNFHCCRSLQNLMLLNLHF